MFLCPSLLTLLDPRGRTPASPLAQVLGSCFSQGPLHAPLSLPGQPGTCCPPISPTQWLSSIPGTLSLSCLWTVRAWVTSLTWLSCAGSTSLVGLGWPVPKSTVLGEGGPKHQNLTFHQGVLSP